MSLHSAVIPMPLPPPLYFLTYVVRMCTSYPDVYPIEECEQFALPVDQIDPLPTIIP